jgi:hypothetical protein
MVMGDLHDWLAEGAPGGDLREYHRPTVHRLELVEGNELFSPIELETLLGRKGDGRTIRNWARASVLALDDMWEAELGHGYFLLLHNPETQDPMTLRSGHRVAIISRPAEGSKPGRPPKGQEWRFALADPRDKCGHFYLPKWLSRS